MAAKRRRADECILHASGAPLTFNMLLSTRLTERGSALAAAGALVVIALMPTVDAQDQPASCRVSGKASSGGTALPGVSILISAGDRPVAATSTDVDGSWRAALAPGASYRLQADLTGFDRVERSIELTAQPCDQTIDLQLALAPRVARPRETPPAAPAAAASRGRGGAPAAGRGDAPAAGRGPQFETLAVQTLAPAGVDVAAAERETPEAAARLLLPPGFSTEGPTEAVAINGNMASLDRGMMMDRLDAIGRGEFDPVTGEFARGGPGAPGQGGAPGGPGGRGGRGGRGGPGGGPGAFAIGGRGGRQGAYTAQLTYTYSGSVLDSSPYQLRPDSPAAKQPYTRQNFGGTLGGPVRIPGIYNGQRRTTFVVNYGGNRGGDLFDRYATVPTDAMRAGDFSSEAARVLDPVTGDPFPGNRIPFERMSPTSLSLLRFIPLPNLSGMSQNFRYITTANSSTDNVSVRVTHNFTPSVFGGRGGGRGGAGGGRGGRGGGRANQQGTSVVLNAQMQYRRNSGEQLNVFPTLGGANSGGGLALPLSLNIAHQRQLHSVTVNYSRTSSDSLNRYAFVEDVAGAAGISGVSTDPFDWGVPALSFSSFSSLRDVTPSRRHDERLLVGYTWTRPLARHTLRVGGDVRWDRSSNQTDPNANGSFVFTGLYSSGRTSGRGSSLDFADFLLGLPQQASLQYGPGNVKLTGRSMSLFVQDDWRRTSTLTLNLGVRYELLRPFVEENGRMVNLDAAPDFTAVAPVLSGGEGPFTGRFPAALLSADANNVAPRVGFAWRLAPATILRGGYGISYNSGSYSSIARQLVSQPPFAETSTTIGTADAPLRISDPFATLTPSETTNNYGIDKSYDLGIVQTWNMDLSRDLAQVWNLGAGYTHTRGSSLDIVRAPNRGPDGLRIEGVQPFLWQTSEAASVLHAASFRVRRRPVRGIGGGVSYTLARSRDNASSIGGGGTVVAQDDRNLAAEWGLSSFDRRHQLSADASVELPFGPDRPWLNKGGRLAALLSNWRFTTTFTWQSGTPYTPRVLGAASDVARGTNGTLRANYNGDPVQIDDPTIDRYFNVSAFSVPLGGTFGNASRNMIIGPGSRLLNAQLSRDVRLGGNRVLTLQWNANNLLNLVNYAAIDTGLNSPTFGQVLSVRPMRTMQFNVRFRF